MSEIKRDFPHQQSTSSATFLIGDNNRDGLVEPNRLIFNMSANEERSSSTTTVVMRAHETWDESAVGVHAAGNG